MDEAALQEQIAAATAYENFFVPALFQEWAPRVADAAQIQRGQRVLDVACGTGVLAREVFQRVGPNGFVAGLDQNPGMLAVARQVAPGIEWRDGTAEALPYPDRAFDAVVTQFGMMFFTDRSQAVREMLRVLTPGGRLAIAVWDKLENTPAYADEVALIERMAGSQAADGLRAPFVLGDPDQVAVLLSGAGAESVATTTHRGTGKFPSIRSMVEVDLRGWLPLLGIVLAEDRIEEILQEAEVALSRYETADHSVEFDSPAHIITGIKP